MDSLIIKDLHFGYERSSQVFNGWNCEIIGAPFIQIKGNSGSGKTTLFKIISGFLPAKFDKIIVANSKLNANDSPFKRNIAMVFQRSALWQHLSVGKNIQLSRNTNIISENMLNKWSDAFGLKNFINKKSAELSAGEQQRVEILRALASGKKNLILDEPFAFQDNENTEKLIQAINEYREITDGVVIFSTHSVSASKYFSEQKDVYI